MFQPIIKRDIYELTTKNSPINWVMLRGRIRKFCIEQNRNILAENTEDMEKSVRFAIPTQEDPKDINNYLKKIIPEINIELISKNIPNPVLSKLKVNIEERYTL